jgi:hypothetical protein
MSVAAEAEQREPATNAHGGGSKEDDTSTATTTNTKTGTMPTAADILSRPRLPPKKKLAAGTKKQGKKHARGKAEETPRVEDAPVETIDNEELLEQLLTQTNELHLSSPEPTTPVGKNEPTRSSTISKKLHDLGEDIKEVAHAVSSSITPSSPSKLAIPKRKPHRHKLKIANRQAAQLQAQLDAQLESALHPVVDHRKLEDEALLRTCAALNLHIFEVSHHHHPPSQLASSVFCSSSDCRWRIEVSGR